VKKRGEHTRREGFRKEKKFPRGQTRKKEQTGFSFKKRVFVKSVTRGGVSPHIWHGNPPLKRNSREKVFLGSANRGKTVAGRNPPRRGMDIGLEGRGKTFPQIASLLGKKKTSSPRGRGGMTYLIAVCRWTGVNDGGRQIRSQPPCYPKEGNLREKWALHRKGGPTVCTKSLLSAESWSFLKRARKKLIF